MTMTRKIFQGAALAAGLALASASAQALTFQGVTFTTTYVSPTSFTLQIDDALSGGTDNWLDVDFLRALSVKGFGDWTDATVAPAGTLFPGALNNNFCADQGSEKEACFQFDPALALSDDMLFTFNFTDSAITEDMNIHVKVGFLCGIDDTDACGDLLSQDVPFGNGNGSEVPEPATLGLFGLGLLGLGWMRRRRAA